jgi:hypothetical protein
MAAGIGAIVPAATMFQPHSYLWHYLWIGTSVLLVLLAVVFYRRSLQRQFPVFQIFLVFQGFSGASLYLMALAFRNFKPPLVSGVFWWRASFGCLLVEVVLKFALLGEILSQVFKPYPALSKLGKNMIRGVGAVLVLAATLAAAFARGNDFHPMVAASHLLDLADFIIECGLLSFIFLFAAYFQLVWERLAFGIALGLGLAASVQLGTWALWSNLALSHHQRDLLDFLNMAAGHVSVLIWFYYVLTTPKASGIKPDDDDHHNHLSDGDSREEEQEEDERQHDLVVWNRELERLLRK